MSLLFSQNKKSTCDMNIVFRGTPGMYWLTSTAHFN